MSPARQASTFAYHVPRWGGAGARHDKASLSRTSLRRPEGKTVKTIHQACEHNRGLCVESPGCERMLRTTIQVKKTNKKKRWEISEGMTAKTGSQERKISGWSCSSAAEGRTQRMKPRRYRQRVDGQIWKPEATRALLTSAYNKWRDWWADRPRGLTRSSRWSGVDSGRKWWQMRVWGGWGRNTRV